MAKPTTIDVLPFHPKHLEVMDLRYLEKDTIFKLDNIYELIEQAHQVSVESGTFMYDGRILFCAGFSRLWPGVAEGWIIPSRHIPTVAPVFSRYMRRYLESLMASFNLHRFQTVAVDDRPHRRWMRFLGFKPEGVLEKYSVDKQNYQMYARVV